MTEQERKKWLRGCVGKKRIGSEEWLKVIIRKQAKLGRMLEGYKCLYCSVWHLTTKKT